MIRRNPETGQFEAAPHGDGEVDVFAGHLEVFTAAADIGGPNTPVVCEGEDAIVIDFNTRLDSHEVFEAHRIEAVCSVIPSDTASAEHSYQVRYLVLSDLGDAFTRQQDQVATLSTGSEVYNTQFDDDDVLFAGAFCASGDFRDTATGTAGGADANTVHHVADYPAMQVPPPAFDETDEISAPHQNFIVESNDQGVTTTFTVVATGITREL